MLPRTQASQLLPRPDGTYLITGGLGVLGLEVADFLVGKGARRVIDTHLAAVPPSPEHVGPGQQ